MKLVSFETRPPSHWHSSVRLNSFMWSCRFPSRMSFCFPIIIEYPSPDCRCPGVLHSLAKDSFGAIVSLHATKRLTPPVSTNGGNTNSPIIEAGSSKLQTIIFRVRLFVFGSFFVSLLRIFAKSSCQFSTSQVLSEACSDVSVSPPFGPENFGMSKKIQQFSTKYPSY